MKKNLNGREPFVAFAEDKVYSSYLKLKDGNLREKELYKFITRSINDLKKDPFIGIQIPSKLWPKEYVTKHKINNLWKYDLPGGWRLLYTIKGKELEVLSIILEWMTHKKYERKFKY